MNKEKLTSEEKAKVFARYLGCKYIHQDGSFPANTGVNGMAITHILNNNDENERLLLLTPLLSITDEHAFDVARMLGIENPTTVLRKKDCVLVCTEKRVMNNNYNYPLGPFCSISDHSAYHDDNNDGDGRSYINRFVDDYLISEGYAVPLWLGKDHWANGKTAIQLGVATSKSSTK